jgi:hypothetical protein
VINLELRTRNLELELRGVTRVSPLHFCSSEF